MATKKSTGPMPIFSKPCTSTTNWHPIFNVEPKSDGTRQTNHAEHKPAYRTTSRQQDEDSLDTEQAAWTTTEDNHFGSDWPYFTNKRFERVGFTGHVGHGARSED